MPTNLVSPSTCTSCFSVDPSLHDAGSIGPGNCPGPTVSERGDPCYWTVYHDPDATGLPRSGPPHMSCCRGPKSGYKVLARNNPDRIRIVFDDHRSVANAGLLLPATLARHLGLGELVDRHLDLGGAPGRANTGDKVMTLVVSALAGGDCIDAADALRTEGTACTLGGTVRTPSTLGTFLRSLRWGHVRQLDRVSHQLLARAWAAGAGPGHSPFTIDLDSTICETYGLAKEGARHHSLPRTGYGGYTGARGYHPLFGPGLNYSGRHRRRTDGPTAASAATLSLPPAGKWMSASPSPSASTKACTISSRRYPKMPSTAISYWMDGAADVAETTCRACLRSIWRDEYRSYDSGHLGKITGRQHHSVFKSTHTPNVVMAFDF